MALTTIRSSEAYALLLTDASAAWRSTIPRPEDGSSGRRFPQKSREQKGTDRYCLRPVASPTPFLNAGREARIESWDVSGDTLRSVVEPFQFRASARSQVI